MPSSTGALDLLKGGDMTVTEQDILALLQHADSDFDGVTMTINQLYANESHELIGTLVGLLRGLTATQELGVREVEAGVYEGMPDPERIEVYERFITEAYLGIRGLNRLVKDVREHNAEKELVAPVAG